jgi:serine/threonine protein kinase
MKLGQQILNDCYQLKDQLSNKLGRTTFLAQNIDTQEPVIIKILQFNTEFHWDDLKLFEREATTLQNLNHPAIPKYLDFFELPDGLALVQTYIDAPSLETVVKQGRKFSEAEVMELATRLLDILTYLHEQNPPVIHRDIKPSNILLANRSGNSIGDVYLVDFGSVQTVANKDGGTITIVGSYGYIPLEQFGGQTTLASDLYSLGMTLIYLLTGIHPAELPQVNGQVKFTAEISSQSKRWIERMTQPHLDKRFDSAKIARTALTSEDGSYGDFNHLKPVHTQIKLYRDRNRLEIRLRDIDRERIAKIDKIVGLSIALTHWLFVLPIISFALTFIFPWMGQLSIILWYGVLFICPLSSFIFHILGTITKIFLKPIDRIFAFDGQYFYHSTAKLGENKSKILSQYPRSSVDILAYNPGYVFDKYLDENGTEMSRGTVTVKPKLYLYCDNREHVFSDQFSQTELWWLGQELSDFLNLELQVIYPTPQVPPAPSCGGGC